MIPTWFFLLSAVLEIFIGIVSILIALFSYSAYRFSKNIKIFYFSLGFMLISTAMFLHIFLIILNILTPFPSRIFYERLTMDRLFLTIFYIFEILGFFFISLSYVFQLKEIAAITPIMIINPYLEIFIIVFQIFIMVETFINYRNRKTMDSLFIFLAFLFLFLSNFFFTLSIYREFFFITGQTIQLLSFILIFAVYYRAVKNK